MQNKYFSFYVSKFFGEYLPYHKNTSTNTILLYRDCFILFLKFCNEYKNINIDKLEMMNISRKLILEFLSWLEKKRNSSISTRNQRLAAWKSFCKFVQFENPEFYQIGSDIRDIEFKKYPKNTFNYLSIEAIKLILKQPNLSESLGMRDLALLTLMYHSACRVQEIIDLHVYNLKKNQTSTLYVTGKGNKTRIIPLNIETIDILNRYIELNNLKNDDILFSNNIGNKLTRKGVTYILNKYINKAKLISPELFSFNISPHDLRHSKAMHLLEANVNLIYIRDFLGHVSVSTTEIYARANPEIRRKEIETASKSVIEKSKYTKKNKQDLLNYLKQII